MATIELTWDDNSDNEDGFRVYRSTTSSPSFPNDYSQIGTNSADDTTYTDTNAPSGTVYYAVTAYNAAGESAETTTSIETVTAPSSPQTLAFTDTTTEDELSFSWDSVDWGGEQGNYQIYRAEASGTTRSDYTQIDTVTAGTTSYTDANLEDGERYFYRIGATNSAGDSDLSNEIDAVTILPVPTVDDPSVDSDSVTVPWANNDDSPDGGIDVERSPPSIEAVAQSEIHGKSIAVQQDGYGTWVAVQNYEHYGGTNPSVGPVDTFPQLADGLTTASDIETSGANGELRHVDDIDQYGAFEVDAVRLEATTTNHNRKIHFFTTDQTVIGATFTEQSDETDYTDFQGSSTTFYDDHTANLPAAAGNGDADTRSDRIFGTGFPFYNGGNYHWAVKGTGNRWEVDNYPDDNGSGYQFSTVHRVWVRVTGETEATVLANAFETVASGLTPSTTDFTDTSVAEGTTYEYRVKRNTDHATATSTTAQATTPIERFVTAEGTADATVSRTAPTARSATGAGAGDATVARTATPGRTLTADGDRGDGVVSRTTTVSRALTGGGSGDANISWLAPDAWALPKTPGSSTEILLTPSALSTTYDELALTATVSEAKRELLAHYRRAGDVARQTTAFGAFRRIRRDGDDLLTVRPPADSAPPFADRRVAPVDMSADQVAPRRHEVSLTLGLEEPRAREPIEGDDEAITVDTAALDVAGGETETVTLSWTPDGTQLGDWTATVSSETDSDSTLVTVSDAPWTFAWPVATLSLTERRVGQVARGNDAGLPSIELPFRLDAGQVATILAVGSRVEAVEARSVPDGPNTVVDTLPGDELTCELDPPTASDIEAGTYVLRDWSVERARPAPPAYDATVTLVGSD